MWVELQRGLRVGLFLWAGLLAWSGAASGQEIEPSQSTRPVENTDENPNTTTGPEDTIATFNDAIRQVIQSSQDSPFSERHEIMKNAVSQAFDMPVMARRTINRKTWKELTKEQKQLYIETLLTYQSAILADRFKPGSKVEFIIDEVSDGRRKTKLVKTRIIRPDDDDVKLNYLLMMRKDSWRVVDIFLNSTISEVAMRRSEYSAIVSNQGFDALIDALHEQIAEITG
jgi:phospholipid transport system substrate-binding protein